MHHFIFPGIPLLACIAANLPTLYTIAGLLAAAACYLLAYIIRNTPPR